MPIRTAIALIGYATLDFIAHSDGPVLIEGTSAIKVADHGWPRIGGAPVYAGQALAQAGHEVALVCNIGDDPSGADLIGQMRQRGLSTAAIVQGQSHRTPVCVLIHRPDGRYCCFLDRGDDAASSLSPGQQATLRDAAWVVITAGRSDLAEQALALMAPGQKLAWIVKADATSFPPALCDRLRQRAAIIFHNRHESAFLGQASGTAPKDQLLFETDGEHGVHIHQHGRTVTIPTAMLQTLDATGAGDTFAGAALSLLIEDMQGVEAAARAGLAAATRLLEQRRAAARPYAPCSPAPHEA